MPSTSFFLECDPPTATAQGKRMTVMHGKPIFFESKEMKEAKKILGLLLSRHAPSQPISGPLALTIEVDWPFRQEDLKRRDSNRIPHVGKPDLDNWVKGFMDLLVDMGFFEKDHEVAELNLKKFRSLHPGINVKIEQIECAGASLTLPGLEAC